MNGRQLTPLNADPLIERPRIVFPEAIMGLLFYPRPAPYGAGPIGLRANGPPTTGGRRPVQSCAAEGGPDRVCGTVIAVATSPRRTIHRPSKAGT